jgi:hypothetical protein
VKSYNRWDHAVRFSLSDAAIDDPHLASLLEYASKSLPRQLTEDVATGVIPAGLGNWDSSRSLELHPASDDISDMLAAALGESHDFGYALYSFVHGCVATMLNFGDACFEIVYEQEVDSNGLRQFYLSPIPPTSLDHTGDKMPVQRIPKRIARAHKVPKAIQIARSHLIIFELPTSFRQDLPPLIERLAVLSDPLIPDFGIKSIGQTQGRVPFDFNVYSRSRKLAIVEASQRFGWTGGLIYGLNDQEVVEHYWWHRELIFLRFNTEVRNSLIATLNDGLLRARKVTGVNAQLQLNGFPTLEEVDSAITHLQSGDRPLSETHDLIRRARGHVKQVD